MISFQALVALVDGRCLFSGFGDSIDRMIPLLEGVDEERIDGVDFFPANPSVAWWRRFNEDMLSCLVASHDEVRNLRLCAVKLANGEVVDADKIDDSFILWGQSIVGLYYN